MPKTAKSPVRKSAAMKRSAPAQLVESKETKRYRELIPQIEKRDGRIVSFNFEKIVEVIHRAMTAADEGSHDDAVLVAHQVAGELARIAKKHKHFLPTVESIQDDVEKALMFNDFTATAKAYILYRDKRAQMRTEEAAIPAAVRAKIKDSSKYFDTAYQEFIFYQFYSRWNDELGRRETWEEAIDRFISFMKERLGNKLNEKEYAEVRQAILERAVCPSMRLLWGSGKATRATDVTAYNCAYVAPTSWRDLSEIMYVSMCGAGVGFAVEPQNAEQFPQIQKQSGKKAETIVVEDSKEGWCEAFVKACEAWENGLDVDIDYSRIRAAGERLVVMGGRASGPGPLQELMQFTRRKMLARQGRRLTPLNLHDIICQIGLIVVAGGVRRSALISLSSLDDMEMRDAKKGAFWQAEGQRSMANNSAVYETRPTAAEFLEEWTALVTSGSGERGIFNRGGLEKQVPARRWAKLKGKSQVGVNPCVPADTWVMTDQGARKVVDLIDRPFTALVDGKAYPSEGFYKTGDKQLFEVRTDRGYAFRATDNHRVLTIRSERRGARETTWKEVQELAIGDRVVLNDQGMASWEGKGGAGEGWLLGSLLGDGNIENGRGANLDYWGENRGTMMAHARELVHATVGARSDLTGHLAKTGYARLHSVGLAKLAESYDMTYADKLPKDSIEEASSAFYEGFLRGWFDADGSVQGNQTKGVSVRLAANSRDSLAAAQRMLARLGIMSTVYENRRDAAWRELPNGKGGTSPYFCQANHELVISGANLRQFASRIGFVDAAKSAKLDTLLASYARALNRESFAATVTGITPDGTEAVYDCTVPGVHAFDGNGVMLHNCGEIYLRSKQFCNLTSIVVRPADTMTSLKKKIRMATILGTYQATLTNFGYLSKEWKNNCEEEQLLGVSITGYYDNKIIRNDKNLEALREEAVAVNKEYAKRFKKSPSTAITCVKPHGNSGQLLGVGSGMHPWFSPYFIRRVRISVNDPLLKLAEEQGVPIHPEVGYSTSNATTMVLEFPVKAPEGAVHSKEVSALTMLDEWKRLKQHFTEHNPSVTIYVSDDEWVHVANFVYENWDLVGGLSFLPRNDHVYQLAPYQEITKEEYETRKKALGEMDFSKLPFYEKTDNTAGAKELACVAGICEI